MNTTTPPHVLDFVAVRQQYPAAFAALIAYQKANNPFTYDESELGQWVMNQEHLHIPTNPRDLFDFFDQKGVIVVVDWSAYKDGQIFYSRIASMGRIAWLSDGMDTRTAAESAAFMAAFGKLEDRLKQETR